MINRGTCAVVIVHGQSEYAMISAIKSKLRLNIQIFARDKGKSSIQIDGLHNVFGNKIFKDCKSLLREYGTIEHKKKKLYDFKIFTLMDVDDCKDDSVRKNYIAGNISGINGHELKTYIQPIYCSENLEDVLNDINFDFVAKTNRDKAKYIKVFGNIDINLESMEQLIGKLEKSKKTNLNILLQYLLDHRSNFDS
ncbi:hypothetical protein M5C72_02185 [Companilactobacillus allii]|uniref:Uncharacterized protein n=1 Tax=Companilactobacillus allii TaxID=1847728 RepID=A0A1P8Q270_9LACO|nr:hypothetical protein [Companilactobacillus allii]APX71972.1 hypothetical protein BTM29_05105 [Companilactobacillus allii]USQ69066.1 hypothetical protein M5C72_02185 [Companilactobacillus allii]